MVKGMYMYTHTMECYLAIKKVEHSKHLWQNGMNLKGIKLSEVKSDRERQNTMISLIYGT